MCMLVTVRAVFGPKYIIMAVGITGLMLFGMLILSEFLFLDPYIIGHIPSGTESGFVLILAISILAGFVIPMNIYRMVQLRGNSTKMGGGVLVSLVGAVTGACSCGPIGFAVISTFGSVGSAAASFLTNYEIPIKIAALAVLSVTIYTTHRSLKTECSLR